MAVKLAIFDLDGTLVNTIEDVCDCFNQALENCGHSRVDDGVIAALVGKPLPVIVRGLLPEGISDDEVDAMAGEYRRVYGASAKPNTKPYPGIPEMLAHLQAEGVRLAVNSNKPHEATVEVVNRMFPKLDMDVVGFGAVVTTKPDPAGANLLMERVGVIPADTVYVGDTVVDVDTADAAGVRCVLVTWGQGTPELRDDSRIWVVAEDAVDLLNLFLHRD